MANRYKIFVLTKMSLNFLKFLTW